MSGIFGGGGSGGGLPETPLSIANGGTNATTAPVAKANLGVIDAFVNVKATPGYDVLPAYTPNEDNTVLTANANGALAIDYADPLVVGDLVWLFYTAPVGIYEITALGDESNPWVLTLSSHSTPPVDGSWRTVIVYVYGGWYLQGSMWYYSVATGSSGWSPVFRDGQQVTKPGDVGTVQNGKHIGSCPYYWSDGFLYATPWWTKDTGQIANVSDPVEAKDVANKEYVDGRKVTDLTAPSSDFSMNSHKITDVTDPSSAQDAATKAYVDANTETVVVPLPLLSGSTITWTQTGTWTTDTTAGLYQQGALIYNSTGNSGNTDKLTSSAVNVPVSGSYHARVLFKKGTDCQKWKLLKDGVQVGGDVDAYASPAVPNSWQTFDLGALTAGTSFVLAVQGLNSKNGLSTAFYVAVQAIILTKY